MPITKRPLPFGEWRPDIALLDNEFASEAENVFAGVNSYKPFPRLEPIALASLMTGTGNDQYTKIMLHLDGADGPVSSAAIIDNAAGATAPAHSWTAVGATIQLETANKKFGSASLLLSGSGEWLSIPDHNDFSLGNNNFTIECWCNPATSGTLLYIAAQADLSQTAAGSSFFISRTAANQVEANVSTGVGFVTLTGTSTTFTAGTWRAIALERTGNTLTLYMDGAIEATATFSGVVPNSTRTFRIGAGGELSANPVFPADV